MQNDFRKTKTHLVLTIKAEYPWRARVHNKPLWLALILHPITVKYRKGIIYMKERIK
jgi:hypothetical protein